MLWGWSRWKEIHGRAGRIENQDAWPGLLRAIPTANQGFLIPHTPNQPSQSDPALCSPNSIWKKHQAPKTSSCSLSAPPPWLWVKVTHRSHPCVTLVWVTPLTAGNIPPKQLSHQKLPSFSWWAEWRNPITQNSWRVPAEGLEAPPCSSPPNSGLWPPGDALLPQSCSRVGWEVPALLIAVQDKDTKIQILLIQGI